MLVELGILATCVVIIVHLDVCFGLMRISVTMFPARVRVVTRIEPVSFEAMLAVWSSTLSGHVGLRAALLRVSPPIPFTVVRDGASGRRSLLQVHTIVVSFWVGHLEGRP
jgi:hypothetical protein